MKKRILFPLILLIAYIASALITVENVRGVMGLEYFVDQFIEALQKNDRAGIKELVRTAPGLAFDGIFFFAIEGIGYKAQEKDGNTSFMTAGLLGEIYAEVFNKPELLKLIKMYKQYNPQQSREWMRGIYLFDEGLNYFLKGEWQEAIREWEKASEIFVKVGDSLCEAMVLQKIGRAYRSLGYYAKSLENVKRALEIDKMTGNIKEEAGAYFEIGNIYGVLGQLIEAINNYSQALKTYKNLGDMINEGRTLRNIGRAYLYLGEFEKVVDPFTQAREIARLLKDEGQEAADLHDIGSVLFTIGSIKKTFDDIYEASNYFEQALALNRRLKDLFGEGLNLGWLGAVQIKIGNYKEGIEYLQNAAGIFEGLRSLDGVWKTYRGLGEAFWKSGKGEEAVSYYKKAVEIIEQLYHHTRGLKEEERSSMIGEKSFVYQEFIELLLELHRKSSQKGYDREAFIISEKSKSRTFQELMAKAGAKIALSGDETFKKMIGKEQQLIGELTNLRGLFTKEMSKPEKERNQEIIDFLKSQVSKTEKSLTDIEKEIEVKYPRYGDLKIPKSLTVEELQEILKPDERVISYAVGKDKLAAFVIGKKRFRLIAIDMKREELAKLLKEFRKGLEGVEELKELEDFDPEVAYRLYNKLFEPLLPELKGMPKLYLTADNILYTLPFEALVDKEIDFKAFREARRKGRNREGAYLMEYATIHYLLDTHTFTYLPSASVLRSLRKYEKAGYGRWNKSLIAFADPIFSEEDRDKVKDKVEVKEKEAKQKGISPETQLMAQLITRSTGSGKLERLKESAQEAEAIANEVKGRKEDIYLREKATEENIFKTNLKESRYILFSTHGLLGGDFSGVAEPALALTLIENPPGRDGFLTMSEVLGLDLNSELIILSACNTSGRGDRAGSGEGFVGLTRSFMYAGSKSILVTHWSVESESAKDLMVNTFKNMNKEGKSESLRRAKLAMKDSSRQISEERFVGRGVRLIEGPQVAKMEGEKRKPSLSLSHPFFWAPFVLVGEGR